LAPQSPTGLKKSSVKVKQKRKEKKR
jgi:hypothetical protein